MPRTTRRWGGSLQTLAWPGAGSLTAPPDLPKSFADGANGRARFWDAGNVKARRMERRNSQSCPSRFRGAGLAHSGPWQNENVKLEAMVLQLGATDSTRVRESSAVSQPERSWVSATVRLVDSAGAQPWVSRAGNSSLICCCCAMTSSSLRLEELR